MRTFLKIGALVVLAMSSYCFAGEIIDRLVASVDNVPILQSDWDQSVAFEALQQGRVAASFKVEERRAALERLVDQQLLRSQMGDENMASADERDVSKEIERIRATYPAGKTDEGWQRLLAECGLDEAYVQQKVARQLQVMRFVDLRLRPETRVPREDVEDYYKETLVPAVRSRGAKEESLTEAYPQIEEILRQQRLDELLTTWLRDLRDHSDIQWLGGTENSPSEGAVSVSSSGGK